jgi:pyruvate,water dikinase
VAETLGLDEIEGADRERVGGKAFALARLRRHGLPVPDGFVLVAGGPLDGARREALTAAYRALGAGPVAVRSSSGAEDLETFSFAGQYRTLLDVSGEDALVAAVERCLASAGDAERYAAALGAPAGAMAVLVQRFVEPSAAGVAFTRHPRDPGALLIEAHAGRGEALVSGRVTPDRYVLDRDSGALREKPPAGSLEGVHLKRIASLAREAERLFGAPQDVEWALAADGPVLLQSRPITVDDDAPRDPHARRLTRANVGEVLPDPVTPLTWATLGGFLEHGFRETARAVGLLSADLAGVPFLVLHRRRVYLNLSLSLEVAKRLPGVSSADAERLVLGAGGAGAGRHGIALSALPSLAGVALRALALNQRLPSEIAAIEALVRRLPSREVVLGASPERLVCLLHEFFAAGRATAITHIATSGASGVRLALLGRATLALARGEPGDLVNRLVAGLPNVASAAPALALEAIAEEARAHADWREFLAEGSAACAARFAAGEAPAALNARLAGFLAAFGHRAVSEGELSAASWEDDPRPLFAALEALVGSARGAGFGHRARAEERQADEAAILHRLGPLRRAAFARILRGAQDWVRERERTKSLAIALVAHGRRLARRAGRQLVERGVLRRDDDVFFLSFEELLAALEGGSVPQAALARRRRRHEREGALSVPREIDLDAPAGADAPESSWQGIGVSSGVGAGPARIVVPGEAACLLPGEVLVAPVLDAALGPLLVSAAGAIAEIGGMLSHGSVVARELGVPCVVDLRDATRRIRNGDRVLVDGGTGRVSVESVVDRAAAPAPARAAAPADATDECLHAFELDPRARESVYFNLYDPRVGVGMIASQGVRPGPRGEAILAIALPDGRVLSGLALGRPTISAASFGLGGFSTRWSPPRLSFRGRLAPWEGADFPPGPLPLLLAPRTLEVQLELAFEATTPAIDLVQALGESARAAFGPLGRCHVEQSGRYRGSLSVDGRRFELDATGSRDHSWGLRDWSAADHWRLFTLRLGDDFALHALAASVAGQHATGGFLWRDGRATLVSRVAHAFEPGARPRRFVLEVATEDGAPLTLHATIERTLSVPVDPERRPLRLLAGRPWALVLHENFTRYECEGRSGYGIAELTERPR